MNLQTVVPATFLAVLFLLVTLLIFDWAGGSVTVAGVGDLVVGVAAFIGATTAVLALNTWKKQRDSEVAKKLAAVLYQYRLSLHRIRHPFPTSDDQLQSGIDEVTTEVSYAMRMARWRKSRLKQDEVNALLAEADLHWPRKASEAFEDVLNVEKDLFFKIGQYERFQRRQAQDYAKLRAGSESGGASPDSLTKLQKEIDERRDKIQGLETTLNDDFTDTDEMRKRINASFERFEAFLRSRI